VEEINIACLVTCILYYSVSQCGYLVYHCTNPYRGSSYEPFLLTDGLVLESELEPALSSIRGKVSYYVENKKHIRLLNMLFNLSFEKRVHFQTFARHGPVFWARDRALRKDDYVNETSR
jgi:hypothetical protein